MKVNLIHPSLVEAGLEHVGVTGVRAEDNGAGGFTLSYEQDFTVGGLLGKLADIGMEQYVVQTRVLPSNAQRLRQIAHEIKFTLADCTIDDEAREIFAEIAEDLHRVADNIAPQEGAR